jgi:hypothetical protein
MSAREWVEWLTDTTVVLDPPLQPFRRPDPFAEPVVRFDALPTRVADPEEEYKQWVSPPRYAVGGTVVSGLRRRSGEQRRPFLETAGYTGGRSLIHHLADSDWKPSTATAESCAWEYDPAPTNFWGTPPLGIRFRF